MARETRSPWAVWARRGRWHSRTGPDSTSGIRRGWGKISPSISFLYALILADRLPGTFRRTPQASLKNPLIW